MKPQQLADLLNISSATLRRWAGKEYAEFLSPGAQGANGAHRTFSELDARIIAWIAMMRAQNTPPDDILATLRSAQSEGWKKVPVLPGGMANDEPIFMVPREAVEERFRGLQERHELELQAIIKERDEARAQLEMVRREAETVRREAAETVQKVQSELSDTIKSLQQRIVDLSSKEAELRGLLTQYSIGGKRRSAVTLVVAALLAGTILMAVVILVALFAAVSIAGQH